MPRRTVRLRLTLIYSLLFLVSGVALLGITYFLVEQRGRLVLVDRIYGPTQIGQGEPLPPLGARSGPAAELRAQAERQRAQNMRDLLIQSGTALALMTMLSVGLGWLMAGRVLRPVRTMTASTRRISEHNLHERLALTGPSDELKDLGDTIDGLLGRLEAAFDAQRRFVANASHELRTPLAMMRTSLDVAVAKPGGPEIASLEGKLREGLDRADTLLESFLALARAQHGAVAETERVALDDVVAAALDSHQEAIAAKRIEVSAMLQPTQVRGSAALLSHMAGNLVDNAVRHNVPHGELRITVDAGGLVVENGGERLQASDVRELVQPFRRIGVARTGSENGVGLGLSIVAAVTAAHGGDLELRARPQGGLRVAISLPRA
jgi:signal transduction histidine kinase